MSDAKPAERSPAEVYDELFVPALFRQWGEIVADAARIAPGARVLDVACGTGVLALAAARRAGARGSVAGLDANAQMLEVARRKSSAIEWHNGRAESLPFDDARFDAVVSQFGMMFFDDRIAALREMLRVLRRGGRLAVAVCDDVERSPGYSAFAHLLQRLFGERVADAFRAPFALGDPRELLDLATRAGIGAPSVVRRHATVRFESIAALVSSERACAWTLGGILDDDQFDRLLAEAHTALRRFRSADGTVEFDMPALILAADKEVDRLDVGPVH